MKGRGCAATSGALLLFWGAGIAVARLLPLGDEPRNASERIYFENARQIRAYANHHPIPALLSGLFVYRVSISDLRHVPGSCDGGSDGGIPAYSEVLSTVTDHSIYGIPVARYAVSCSGNGFTRGAPDYTPRMPEPEPLRSPGAEPPPVPPPPPIGGPPPPRP